MSVCHRLLPIAAGAFSLAVAVLTAAPPSATAAPQARSLWAPHAPEDVRIDGVPKEWAGSWRALEYTLQGDAPSAEDLQARVMLATDEEKIYVAAEVRDDTIVANADHVELLLGIPGGTVRSFRFFPGVPGKSRGRATLGAGPPLRGAKVVEAPATNGYSLEAELPWASVPGAKTIRVGLRGAVLVHDADGSRRIETVISTAPTREYRGLPALSTETEIGLATGLLHEKRLLRLPRYNLLGDLAGDPLVERVLVYGSFLAVLGPGYRNGSEYYFRDLGVDSNGTGLPSCELADVTGDGRADILLRKRYEKSGTAVESVEILSYHGGGDAPERIFAAESSWHTPNGSLESDIRITRAGGASRIVVRAAKAKGLTRSTFQPPFRTDVDPILAPWDSVASRTFAFRDSTFVKVAESAAQSGSRPSNATRPPDSGSSASSGKGGQSDPYAQYRRDRHADGAPRFRVDANLTGDGTREHAVLHDRDLVVYGPGIRDGSAYLLVTLTPFASSADIASLKAQDVTGDGRAELLVEGVMRAEAPPDAGGGTVSRRVLLIYAIGDGSIRRVFGAEIERAIGKSKVVGVVSLGRGQIVLRPGRAVGFTEQTYPFAQEVGSGSGFEPLLLPWSGARPVSYGWDGERFAP